MGKSKSKPTKINDINNINDINKRSKLKLIQKNNIKNKSIVNINNNNFQINLRINNERENYPPKKNNKIKFPIQPSKNKLINVQKKIKK